MSDPPPAAPDELLDRGYLAELIEIDPDDVQELVDCMMADVPGMLAEIEGALASGDREAGKTVSHTLRGMLLNFGCVAMARRLLDFEKSGWAAGADEDPAQVASELAACWDATREALKRWLEEIRESQDSAG